ncbi:pyridoxamine 5'-phosphate oxidase family protein [[Mycobacterium] burgundiense]|uniref:Pyridoxamine 5'-phosphate oxidase family protein n=1 Tax=[Mycobacterium] burgundiense TaxID=3064286 RepID=A0ABM9LBA4_9MYCO|nr:pyridoxamine 5'-phosphate oxidase family protein [Mycolicibacterium sp. MU0053]CAJ1496102.1 pyridoxamine 5'-phosphate oxidase family protein [Mycolicibacterium sp. MU0053]
MNHFHAGELAVQQRMGQSDIAAKVGNGIHRDIPEAAANFLAEQPMVVVGAADAGGRLWASELVGPPGFVRAVDQRTIAVAAHPAPGDPLAAALTRPTRIGMIALQPQRRRRMRANGAVAARGDGLLVTVDQVYSNCPKYISRRHLESFTPEVERSAPRRAAGLDERQRRMIAEADTFFVATADADGNADASHRGGNPGFVQVLSANRLRWPDYRGNSLFMTLGNIEVNPHCGLLVMDWASGATLQLTGVAQLVWEPDTFTDAAQCFVEFNLSEVVERDGPGPLRWSAPELSPANP